MIDLNELKSRKALLIFGAVLLTAAVVYRFFPDTQGVMGNDTMVQKQLKLEKYRSLLANEKNLKAALVAGRRTAGVSMQMLLQSDTPAIAAVEIQDRVQQIAGRLGVTIESTRFLEPVKNETPELKEYLAIPIQFSIDEPIEKVKSLLYNLEASNKMISVQEIRARSKNTGNETIISATFIIWGYMKAKTESDTVEKPA